MGAVNSIAARRDYAKARPLCALSLLARRVLFRCFLMTAFAGAGSPDVDFTTIEGVRAIFSTDIGVLIGWSHYLVFDLFVGAWIGRDALRRGVTHWLAAPSILLSFILGPAGLLLYMIGRFALTRTAVLAETDLT